MTRYPLRITWFTKLFVPGVLIFMIVLGALIMFPKYPEPYTVAFSLVWFGILGYMCFFVFSLPLEVIHHPDGTLEFRGALRRRRIPISSLRLIEPVPNQFGVFYFRHDRGKITSLTQFDGFHELIFSIKSINPRVELRGC